MPRGEADAPDHFHEPGNVYRDNAWSSGACSGHRIYRKVHTFVTVCAGSGRFAWDNGLERYENWVRGTVRGNEGECSLGEVVESESKGRLNRMNTGEEWSRSADVRMMLRVGMGKARYVHNISSQIRLRQSRYIGVGRRYYDYEIEGQQKGSRGSRITYSGRQSISHRCPIELLLSDCSSLNGRTIGVTWWEMKTRPGSRRAPYKRPNCLGRESRPPLVEYRSQSGDRLKPVLGEQRCPHRRG